MKQLVMIIGTEDVNEAKTRKVAEAGGICAGIADLAFCMKSKNHDALIGFDWCADRGKEADCCMERDDLDAAANSICRLAEWFDEGVRAVMKAYAIQNDDIESPFFQYFHETTESTHAGNGLHGRNPNGRKEKYECSGEMDGLAEMLDKEYSFLKSLLNNKGCEDEENESGCSM